MSEKALVTRDGTAPGGASGTAPMAAGPPVGDPGGGIDEVPLPPVDRMERCPTRGYGWASGHHGEILQGLFKVPDEAGGRLCRGLVTLPCRLFWSEATFLPDASGVVRVTPAPKSKVHRAVGLALSRCGGARWGGHLWVRSNIPPRLGFGSSTSDVTAAIRAVADAFGLRLPSTVVAELAVQAEVAADSVMFGQRAVLFAHRDGQLIEDFGQPLPALEVLGFNTDPTGAGVDTVTLAPACYSWREIEAFQPLVALMRRAVHVQDARLVGRAASASARINQRYLPTPHFDRLERLVAEVEALGVQVAHSGTAAGLLFDPSRPGLDERVRPAQARLAELGFGSTWRFRAGGVRASEVRRSAA
ncbi:MAG TPA: hypothetical protein VG370_34240 [Chloroflexota bacterium]|nr:hypothetical protein [Chloroflexota bacterium]